MVAGRTEGASGQPIDDLALSALPGNFLLRAGILTIADLLTRTEDDLLGLYGFGPGMLAEVTAALSARGMRLPGEPAAARPGTHEACDGMIARATEKIGDLKRLLAERDAEVAAAGRDALLALAGELDDMAARMRTDVGMSVCRAAAEAARRRAASPPSGDAAPFPASLPAPGTSQGVSGALSDADCMEAGPS